MKYFILFTTMLSVAVQSCNSPVNNSKKEENIIYLDTLLAAPQSNLLDTRVGDKVAVIENNQSFQIDGTILKKTDTAYLIGTKVGRSNLTEWVTAEDYKRYYSSNGNAAIQDIIIDAYQIQLGAGRLSKTIWVTGTQLYKAPWIELNGLKKGDSVIIKRYGDFEPYHAVLIQDVKPNSDYVIAKYNEYNSNDDFNFDEVFHKKTNPNAQNLQPGDIVYLDKLYWAMVLAEKDNDHIFVRTAGFPAKDLLVPINKLERYE
jgi:hypothetical protein